MTASSVLTSRPYVVAIIANVARGYTTMGNLDKALEYLERARRLQPRASGVRSLEVILLSRSGKEARALELGRQAIAENVHDYDLANAVFLLAWRSGDYPLASKAMHLRMDRSREGDVAANAPSHYLRRFHYDTILHDAETLRFLASKVSTDRLVLGSDDPFPPMDKDPLASVRSAGFSPEDLRRIVDDNPRRLLKLKSLTPPASGAW